MFLKHYGICFCIPFPEILANSGLQVSFHVSCVDNQKAENWRNICFCRHTQSKHTSSKFRSDLKNSCSHSHNQRQLSCWVIKTDLNTNAALLHVVVFDVRLHSLELIFTGIKAHDMCSTELSNIYHGSPYTTTGILYQNAHVKIDLFTDTAGILNLFDLKSIMGCPGRHSLSIEASFSGKKENFNVYFSGKRRSLLHPNRAQRTSFFFFAITIFF